MSGGARAVGRIARRQVLSRLRANLLVLLLIALPVAAASGAAVVLASGQPTPEERVTASLGRTAASVTWQGSPVDEYGSVVASEASTEPIVQRNPARIIDGIERTIPTVSVSASVTGSNSPGLVLSLGDWWDQALVDRNPLLEGRAPEAANEVVISSAQARELDLTIGDELTFKYGSRVHEERSEGTGSIVGIADGDYPAIQALEAFDAALFADSIETPFEQSIFLVGEDVDENRAVALNGAGYTVTSAALILSPPAQTVAQESSASFQTIGLIAVIALFVGAEIALLAGAAFAVSARRQQRQLAVLSGVGADARQLRRVVASQGIGIGVVSATAGVVVGVVAGAAVLPVVDSLGVMTIWGLHVPWIVLGVIAAIAVLVAWSAAAAPAARLARLDVMGALRGTSGSPKRSRVRRPLLAIVLVLSGATIAIASGLLAWWQMVDPSDSIVVVYLLGVGVGSLLVLIGVMLTIGPLIAVIARSMSRSPVSLRLAARDATANPSRVVPAVAAIMTAVFVSASLINFANAQQVDRQDRAQYETQARVIKFLPSEPWQSPESSRVSAAERAVVSELDAVSTGRSAEPLFAFRYDELGNPVQIGDAPFAAAIVPEANRCPIERWVGNQREARRDAAGDWRCTESRDNVASTGGSTLSGLVVADVSGLEILLGREPSGAALDAFEGGGAVALYPEFIEDGKVTIGGFDLEQQERDGPWAGQEEPAETLASLPAVLEKPVLPVPETVVISERTASAQGLAFSAPTIMALLHEQPVWADVDRMTPIVEAATGTNYSGIFAQTLDLSSQTAMTLILIAIAALLALASSAIAMALARSEGAADQTVIESVGGTGSQRRAMSFWQGLLIVGLAGVLGAAVSFVPTVGFAWAFGLPFVPQLWVLGLLVFAMPLLIAIGSWVTSRRASVLTQRAVLQ